MLILTTYLAAKCWRSMHQAGRGRATRTRQTGFTLIELLVSIAIVGVLATVVLVAIDPRERIAEAHDAERKYHLGVLKNALEAYAVEHGGMYPKTFDGTKDPTFLCYGCVSSDPKFQPVSDPDAYIPELVEKGYLKRLPIDRDSGHGSDKFCKVQASRDQAGYLYASNGINYKLYAKCVVTTGLDQSLQKSDFCNGDPTTFLGDPQHKLGDFGDPLHPRDAYAIYSENTTDHYSPCW